MSYPKIFLYSCVAITAGVLFSSFFKVTGLVALFFCLLAVVLPIGSLLFRKPEFVVLSALMLSFALGFWRFDRVWDGISNNELRVLNGTDLEFTALVVEPPQTGENQKLVVKPDSLKGKILITLDRYPEYRYGDRLKVSGTLQEPPAFDGFDYQIYLAKSGIFSVMAKPAVERLARNQGNAFYGRIFAFKDALRESLYQNLPYPHSALMAGILLGDQNSLPQCSAKETALALEAGKTCLKLKEEFNVSGLRHLTAVSGMHVAIMVPVLIGFALALGLWRRQAIGFAVAVIWLFILMIGFPASAVRAGVMGTMMVFAQLIGRPAKAGRMVVVAAVFMILQNPMLMRYDVGFQLSFLAVMGMINLAPVVSGLLAFIPEWTGELKSVLAQTLAAQAFTLPILIFNFGYISLYAPLANLLVVPLIDLMTVLGFFLAGIGLIWGGAAWLVSLPNWLLLEYLLRTASAVSRLPYAALNLQIPGHCLAIFYAALGIAMVKIESWRKMKFLDT